MLAGGGGGAAAASPDELAAWRLGARQRLGRVARLEQVWQESIRVMHSIKVWAVGGLQKVSRMERAWQGGASGCCGARHKPKAIHIFSFLEQIWAQVVSVCCFYTVLLQSHLSCSVLRCLQAAAAAAAREMDAAGALAVLCGRRVRFLIRRTCISLGRSTESHGQARCAATLALTVWPGLMLHTIQECAPRL